MNIQVINIASFVGSLDELRLISTIITETINDIQNDSVNEYKTFFKYYKAKYDL